MVPVPPLAGRLDCNDHWYRWRIFYILTICFNNSVDFCGSTRNTVASHSCVDNKAPSLVIVFGCDFTRSLSFEQLSHYPFRVCDIVHILHVAPYLLCPFCQPKRRSSHELKHRHHNVLQDTYPISFSEMWSVIRMPPASTFHPLSITNTGCIRSNRQLFLWWYQQLLRCLHFSPFFMNDSLWEGSRHCCSFAQSKNYMILLLPHFETTIIILQMNSFLLQSLMITVS